MAVRYFRISQIVSSPGRAPGRYPISKAAFLRWVRNGDAPAGIKLGPGVTAWSDEQLDAWDAQKAAHSGGPAKSIAAPVVNKNPCPPSRRPDAKRPGRPRKIMQEAVVWLTTITLAG